MQVKLQQNNKIIGVNAYFIFNTFTPIFICNYK